MTLLLLFLGTLIWFALPFVPAIVELIRATDAKPLMVVGSYDGDIRHFARGFRGYLESRLPGLKPTRRHDGVLEGDLDDGTHVLIVRDRASPLALHAEALDATERRDRLTRRILVTHVPVVLPRRLSAVAEMYATQPVIGGAGDTFRALLCDRDVALAERTTVLRWVHSERDLSIEANSTLFGRASAEGFMTLGRNVRFERIYARRIMAAPEGTSPNTATMDVASLHRYVPNPVADVAGRRWLVKGDLVVPPGSLLAFDLVVTGALVIGEGTLVLGSLKSRHGTVIEPCAHIRGGVVTSGDVLVGRDTIVDGPIVAEGGCTIERGACVGSLERPTTVSAPIIQLCPGAIVHGTVWAREQGEVLDES